MKKSMLGLTMLMAFGVNANQISVENVIVYFENNQNGKEDIFVRNLQDENGYVQINVTEIINPESKEPKRIEHKNIKESGLLVSPNKLVLEPQGKKGDNKAIRIANLNKNLDKERIYRIQVVPVIADFKLKEQTLGVKVLMGYEILTMVQPNNPVKSYDAKVEGNKFKISNTGNANILLHRGIQCKDDSKKECLELETKRVYAGGSFETNLPYGNQPITYHIQFGTNNEEKVFK